VSPEGRAVVAWWRHDAAFAPTADVVQIRRRATFTAPFVGPVTLSRRARNFAPQPVASAAAGGAALVGWADQSPVDSPTPAVYLRVLPKSAPAVPLTTLTEGPDARLTSLRVGLGPTGAAVAVWVRDPFPASTSGPTDAVVRIAVRLAVAGVWSSAGDLSAPGARDPALALAPDGSALVAWVRAGVVEVSRIGPDGVVAGAPVALSAGSPSRLPAVAVNAAGDAVVTWYQNDALVVSERTGGGAFGAPRSLSAGGGFPDVTNLGAPSLGLAADGRTVVAWRQRFAGLFRVVVDIRPAGLDWIPPIIVSPVAARNAGRPSLSVDAAGHAVVAWSQPAGISLSTIRARALARAASAFGALEAVSTAKGRGTAPSVALDVKGRSVLAWREDPVGGPGRFFRAAVRFSPG
jgi:hypothetical protein